jgi:hypothetical protein
MSGLFLIVVSSKIQSLMSRITTILAQPSLGARSWRIAASVFFLFYFASAHAQEQQSGIRLKNVELGSSLISDSDGENLNNYFALFKLQIANIDEVKVWVHQYGKRDLYGRNSLQSFKVEMAPWSWLSMQAGYALMPVGSFHIGKSLGRFYLGFGAGRETVISRSNAIADRIDFKAGYFDFSVDIFKEVSLAFTAERGRFGDNNNRSTFSTSLAFYKQFGKFRIKYTTGYSARKLDHFSVYYWSPEVYREIFLAPDIGLELDSIWIYLNLSVDRILEERSFGNVVGLRSWGVNGELSLGVGLGPGRIYFTGRYWNSGVQKFNSAYSGKIFQVSYELSIMND